MFELVTRLLFISSLVVVEDLVGVLQNGVDHSDLPSSIGYIWACAHQCRPVKLVSQWVLGHGRYYLPEDDS